MKLDYAVTELPNGLRVVTVPMPHVESLSMGMWIGAGGRYEPARLSGISHFIEHLLFKGTATRSARAISEAIEGRGGYFNAYTQEESTCYFARVPEDAASPVFALLSDMYRNPRFAPRDIESERGVILEEIALYRDQPQHWVDDLLGEALWADHPLGRPLAGRPATVRRFSRDDLLRYKDARYVPARTVAAFAGRVRHEDAVRWARDGLGEAPRRAGRAFAPVTARTSQCPTTVRSRPIEQAHLAMGFRLFGRRDPRRYAAKLLSVILGENMSSRLFQVVRERHGLAYSISSNVELFADSGAFFIHAGVDRERCARACALIANELARIADQGPGARELRRAKDYAIGQMRIGMESTSNRMTWAAGNLLFLGRIVQPDEVMRRLESVDVKALRELACAVFRPGRLSAAMVWPGDEDVGAGLLASSLFERLR